MLRLVIDGTCCAIMPAGSFRQQDVDSLPLPPRYRMTTRLIWKKRTPIQPALNALKHACWKTGVAWDRKPAGSGNPQHDPDCCGSRLATAADCLLLVMAGCISYIDRAALSIGNTAIMSSMHMSYTGMGWLLSVFAWAYLVSQIPAGLLADRLGGRMLLGAGLCLWSCAQIGFGLMQGVAGLFVCRILLGMGESPLSWREPACSYAGFHRPSEGQSSGFSMVRQPSDRLWRHRCFWRSWHFRDGAACPSASACSAC